MKERRIDWHFEDSFCIAINKKREQLGYLHLDIIGRHKHWVWRQEEGIHMSPGCLDEVREKMKELFHHRKSSTSLNKVFMETKESPKSCPNDDKEVYPNQFNQYVCENCGWDPDE